MDGYGLMTIGGFVVKTMKFSLKKKKIPLSQAFGWGQIITRLCFIAVEQFLPYQVRNKYFCRILRSLWPDILANTITSTFSANRSRRVS